LSLFFGFELEYNAVFKHRSLTIEHKRYIFWDTGPYIPIEVYRHLRGTYCFHLQGRSVSQKKTKNKKKKKQQNRKQYAEPLLVAYLIYFLTMTTEAVGS
jgi:hypothetical protein